MADAAQNAITSLIQNRSAVPSNVNVRENGGWLFKVEWWPGKREKLPYGTVPADGQLVSRAMFPGFTKGIVAGVVPLVEDSVFLADPTQRGCYTLGDGSTTVRVPDYNGKMADSLAATMLRGDGKLSGGVTGAMQRDALQNITGKINFHGAGSASPSTVVNGVEGAFGADLTSTNTYQGNSNVNGAGSVGIVVLDASKVARTAGETRPFNVTGCWVIRAFGVVKNEAAFDVAGIMAQLAKLNAIGLGASNSAAAPFLANVDATDTASGFYYANLDSVGTRPAGYGMVRVERYPTTDNIAQTWRCPGNINSGSEYQRTYNVSTGAWLPWQLVITTIEDGDWNPFTFVNGWTNYATSTGNAGWNNAGYRRKFNEVQLRGLIRGGNVNSNICQLPVGFRPAKSYMFAVWANTEVGRIDVAPSGDVGLVLLSTTGSPVDYLSLDGIRIPLKV